MFTSNFIRLLAPVNNTGTVGGLVGMLALPVAMLLILYFVMIRPQKKQEKKQKEERSNLKVGDSVITIGGLVGKVVNIKDDDITISSSVADTLVTFRREAINTIVKPKEEA